MDRFYLGIEFPIFLKWQCHKNGKLYLSTISNMQKMLGKAGLIYREI